MQPNSSVTPNRTSCISCKGLPESRPKQSSRKESPLYYPTEQPAAFLPESHQPAAEQAARTDRTGCHGPGRILRKALLCHQCGEARHTGPGDTAACAK